VERDEPETTGRLVSSDDALLISGMTMRTLLLFALAMVLWTSQARGSDLDAPPFDLSDPQVVEKGRVLFNTKCNGGCHGRGGQPGMDGPALAGRDHFTPQFVYLTVTYGRPSRRMPSWKDRISDEEIWLVTAYVMSLQ